jgi:ELWxxDGT repeat protein
MKLTLLTLSLALAFSTQAQTPQLVYDINPGSPTNSSRPTQLISFNGKLYFAADSLNGPEKEMWSYTGSGTPVKEFDQYTGVNVELSSPNLNQQMVVFNNKLYFSGKNDPANGYELMVYDGTNPPALAADIIGGSTSSLPGEFLSFNNKLYFTAGAAGIQNAELYIYDGTNPPVMYDINPGVNSSNPYQYTELNGKIYFCATTPSTGYELFAYNPNTNQVALAAEIAAGTGGGNLSNIIRYNNKIYFTANDPTYGYELYSFDGISATRLTDLAPGNLGGAFQLLGVYNNELYFPGTDNGTDNHLYKYNAVTGITTLADNVAPAYEKGIIYAGKLYFVANDGVHGNELWVHDGINTSMIADLMPGNGAGVIANTLCLHNNALYFSGINGVTGLELYSFKDPLSIQNTKLNGEITLSPNPTTNNATLKLSLQTPNELSIIITDVTGKLVWEKAATNYTQGNTNILLPIENNASGIYFYNVKDNTGSVMSSGKLVKQ